MNRWPVAVLAFVIPASVLAQTEAERFAWSWSLVPHGQAQAWRVRLGPEIMESLNLADAGDLLLTDAQDQPVPFQLLPDRFLIEPLSERRHLQAESTPIAGKDESETGLELVLRQDGSRLVVRSPSAVPQPDIGRLVFEALVGSPQAPGGLPEHRLLLKLVSEQRLRLDCRLRDADDNRPTTRRVGFSEVSDSRPREFRAEVAIAEIPEAWHLACYGRHAPADLALTEAVLESRGRRDHRRTEVVEPPVEPVDGLPGSFRFELAGPYRVRALHLHGAEANLLSQIRVESRIDESGPWRERGKLALSTLEPEASSLTLADDRAARDRYWRIHSEPALKLPPAIEVEARLEELMFLAQGQAPWTLYAGSRADGPPTANQLLPRITEQLGPAWTWPIIEPASRTEAGGKAVLEPPEEPWPWQRYLLWLVLLAGTLVVGLLAIRQLRSGD